MFSQIPMLLAGFTGASPMSMSSSLMAVRSIGAVDEPPSLLFSIESPYICRVNHSCRPNSGWAWDRATSQMGEIISPASPCMLLNGELGSSLRAWEDVVRVVIGCCDFFVGGDSVVRVQDYPSLLPNRLKFRCQIGGVPTNTRVVLAGSRSATTLLTHVGGGGRGSTKLCDGSELGSASLESGDGDSPGACLAWTRCPQIT
jgi:hypothetical protein